MSISITKTSPVSDFAKLWANAEKAGREAAANVMVKDYLIQSVDILTGTPVNGSPQYVMNGVCGFAWLIIKPANSRFAKWLLASGFGRKSSYEGGVRVSISDFRYGQCMERKQAHAGAMCQTLCAAGINCYSDSRMD